MGIPGEMDDTRGTPRREPLDISSPQTDPGRRTRLTKISLTSIGTTNPVRETLSRVEGRPEVSSNTEVTLVRYGGSWRSRRTPVRVFPVPENRSGARTDFQSVLSLMGSTRGTRRGRLVQKTTSRQRVTLRPRG